MGMGHDHGHSHVPRAADRGMRRRLVIATLACIVLIFSGIGLVAQMVARHESEELFSARLATSARVLEALVAQELATATLAHPLVRVRDLLRVRLDEASQGLLERHVETGRRLALPFLRHAIRAL